MNEKNPCVPKLVTHGFFEYEALSETGNSWVVFYF